MGCSPWGCKESDTTEQLHFHFSLSCIGEGNGNPLQCSCLENSRDSRAWWAAVYGVAQSHMTEATSQQQQQAASIAIMTGETGEAVKGFNLLSCALTGRREGQPIMLMLDT